MLPHLRSPFRGAADSFAAASPSRHPPVLGEDSAVSPMRHAIKADESTAPPPPPPNQCPIGGTGAGKSESSFKNSKPLIEYRRQSRNSVSCSVKNSVPPSSPDRDDFEEKSEKKLKGKELDDKESRSSKFLIKIRTETSKVEEEIQVQEKGEGEDNEGQEEGKLLDSFDDEEPLQKTWNFRPRKPIRPSLNLNGSWFKNNGCAVQLEKRTKSPHMNPNSRPETHKKEKKRKTGFTLTLSREEIEEDLFAIMGSKTSRRSKKRSKTVQRLIDNAFPGSWLQSITADLYKVSEHP